MRLDDPDPPQRDPLAEGLRHFGAAEPDHEQAVYWFQLAADAGDAEGLAMLAQCQLEGLGLPRDPVRARERLEQAAAAGSVSAAFHLGRALVAGWGGAADATRALALYTAAAAQGHGDATFNLAACLDAGWGCQPDRLGAKALFLRARALGSPLRAPGLRIRGRELAAVRELARRIDQGDLARLIDERQREITRVQGLARPARRRRHAHQQRQRLLLTSGFATVAATVLALLGRLFGGRPGQPLAGDAGPTSIA